MVARSVRVVEAMSRLLGGEVYHYYSKLMAKPPETWAEVLEDAKVLKEKFPDMQPVVFPLAVDDPMVATFLPMIAAYGGTIPIPWYDGNLYPEFQNGPGQEAIAILQELTDHMPADVLDMDYDRENAHMAQGLAAYALNWNAYLPVLLDSGSSRIHESVAFDGAPGGPAGRFSGLGGWQMGVSSQSANKEAAFRFSSGSRAASGASTSPLPAARWPASRSQTIPRWWRRSPTIRC